MTVRRWFPPVLCCAVVACTDPELAPAISSVTSTGSTVGAAGGSVGSDASGAGAGGAPAETTGAGGGGDAVRGNGGATSGGAAGSSGVGGSPGAGGASGGPPAVAVCGDGWRDVATEGCDDGDLSSGDACGPSCAPTDLVLGSALRLASGPHGAAATDGGLAIALLSAAAPPVLSVAFLDGIGHPLGPPQTVDDTSVAPYLPDPALASLPDGSFALAYTDVDGDGDALGIALRTAAAGAPPGPLVHANATTSFNQEDPDLVWTGSELVVAWVDTSDDPWGDVVVRTFDAQLAPTSGEAVLSGIGAADARPTLVATSSGWAVAWRSSDGSTWDVHVATSQGGTWSISPCGPADIEERPALTEIAPAQLLVVCSELTGLAPTTSQLRHAVLDTSGLDADAAAVVAPIEAGALRPKLEKVGTRTVLAYGLAAPVAEPLLDETMWRYVTHDAVAGTVSFSAATPAPRAPGHQLGDQGAPVLEALPYWPEGAALLAWEDAGGISADISVVVTILPLPEQGGPP